MSASVSSELDTPRSILLLSRYLGTVNWRVSILFSFWVFAVCAVASLTVVISGAQAGWPGAPLAMHFTREMHPLWQYMWARWDGQWYLNIAYYGYGSVPRDVAFFPLYPVLLASVHAVTGLPWAGSGLVVTYVCLALAIYYLFKLALLDFDRGTALRSVVALLLYPTAFFLLAVYTESLVLFLVCASLYYARTGRWWLVAALAYACGLAKITSLSLGVAIACEAVFGGGNAPHPVGITRWRVLLGYLHPRDLLPRLSPGKVVAIIAGPLGVGSYMGYLAWRFGDPLAFMHVQSAWRGDVSIFEKVWTTIAAYWDTGITVDALPHLGDAAALALMAGLSIYMLRAVRFSYAALLGGLIAVILLSGDPMSVGRMIVSIGPVFIGLASAARRTPRTWLALMLVFAALQAYFVVRFFLWTWVD